MYIGCRIHGKAMRSKVGLDKKRRPEDEWKIIENAHPALVPEKLFDYVQRVNFGELEKRNVMFNGIVQKKITGICSGIGLLRGLSQPHVSQ